MVRYPPPLGNEFILYDHMNILGFPRESKLRFLMNSSTELCYRKNKLSSQIISTD